MRTLNVSSEDFMILFFGMALTLTKIIPSGIGRNPVFFRLSLLISIYVGMIMALVLRGCGKLKFH
jgi:hypothetical protein